MFKMPSLFAGRHFKPCCYMASFSFPTGALEIVLKSVSADCLERFHPLWKLVEKILKCSQGPGCSFP